MTATYWVLVAGTCRICGGLRELAGVPWCAKCLSQLHQAICSKPFGHLDRCDPVYWDLPDEALP